MYVLLARKRSDNLQADATERSAIIQETYDQWEHGLKNFYFDSSTIFPDTTYSANLQIEVPSYLEKGLKYIIFSFDIDDENNQFCFYCGDTVKKWYHF